MSASGIQKEANFICNDDKDTEQELDCFDVCFICEKSMKDVEKCRRQCHGSFHPSCLGRLSAIDGELLSEECATGRFPWDRMVSSFCKLFFSCCCFWFALDVYLWQFMVFFLDSRQSQVFCMQTFRCRGGRAVLRARLQSVLPQRMSGRVFARGVNIGLQSAFFLSTSLVFYLSIEKAGQRLR